MLFLESVVFYLVRELMNLLQSNRPEWLLAILVASLMWALPSVIEYMWWVILMFLLFQEMF